MKIKEALSLCSLWFTFLLTSRSARGIIFHSGVPIGENMNRISAWQPVIDRVKKKLAGWKGRMLSIGGRLTLIKAVLGSLPLYFFSLFHAPEAVIHTLESLRAKFFWGGGNGERKISWISWLKILKDKRDGGLGVGGLKENNDALLGKWWWRFRVEENSLWRRIICALYGEDGGLESDNIKGGRGKVWSNIIRNCLTLERNGVHFIESVRWIVGDGSKVKFWKDMWIGDKKLCDRFPRLFSLAHDKNCRVKDRWRDEGWNWDWRRRVRGREVGELEELCLLASNHSLLTYADDTPWWIHDNKGHFSVKGLKILIKKRSNSNAQRFCFIWNNLVPSKINIFGWRVILRRLPTRENIAKRGIILITSCCPMCNDLVENEGHLFLLCPLAKDVWRLIFLWCGFTVQIPTNLDELFDIQQGLTRPQIRRKVWDAILKTTLWIIWLRRNAVIFNAKNCTVKDTFDEIQFRSFEWVTGRQRNGRVEWNDWKNSPKD